MNRHIPLRPNVFAYFTCALILIGRTIRRSLKEIIILGALSVTQIALAQNGFQGLAVSATEGIVGDNNTFSVSFSGSVSAIDFSDAVSALRIYEAAAILKEVTFQVGYDKFDNPINTPRSFGMSTALAAGIHHLYVEAVTVNGGFDSQVFTITVKAADGTVPGAPPPKNVDVLMAAINMLLDDDTQSAPVTPPVPLPPTIILKAPTAGTTLAPGSLAAFTIAVGGPSVVTVKLYVDNVLIGNAQGDAADWFFNWTAGPVRAYSIVAKSFDASGSVLAASAPVILNVTGTLPLEGAPSSATPIAVNITLPPFGSGEAGTLPGSFTVGNDGTASYDIDLVVPPGTANMQPMLSLNYSSNGNNGMVGLGWSLGGLSTIHRCVKTIAQDGYPGRIAFDTGDRLCLDGMRLLRFDGTSTSDDAYWQSPNGAQYRTEIEGFARITRQVNGGFKVELKDGRIQYYGTDSNSAIAAQGRIDGQPLLWALARMEDRSGNYMTYEYSVDGATGEYLPKQIRYGGNTSANQTADLAVRFQQDPRPDDAQIQYMGGSRNDLRNRLTHIRTYIDTAPDGTGGTLARDYAIGYRSSTNSGRSLIDFVQVCGDDGKCLPKTQMGWGSSPLKMVQKYVFDNYVNGDNENIPLKYVSGDFDGSGKTSIFYPILNRACAKCPGDLPWYLSGAMTGIRTGSSAIELIGALLTLPPGANKFSELISGDFNGDGRDDLVLVDIGTRVWAYCLSAEPSNGSPTFSACKVGGQLPARRANSLTEADLPSMVSLRNNGKAQLVALDVAKKLYICSLENDATNCTTNDTVTPADAGTFELRPVVLSKQGMTDYYTVTLSGGRLLLCNYLSERLVCRNMGNAMGMAENITPADMNGDGLTDVFIGGNICISKETDVECNPYTTYAIATDFSFVGPADFTGNGVHGFWASRSNLPDPYSLCHVVDNTVACNSANTSEIPKDNLGLYLGGNSMPVFIDETGVPASLSCSEPFRQNSNSVQKCRVLSAISPAGEDLLSSVVNGIGQREEVEYARGDDGGVYSHYATINGYLQRPIYPQVSISPGSMVKYLRRNNGQGGWITSSYRYAGAMFDATGRGSLGFTTIGTTDSTGISSDSTLSQAFPYIGMVLNVVKTGTDCKMEDTSSTLENIPFSMNAGGQSRFVYSKQVRSTEALDCIDARTISTTNQYNDGWGNLNSQTVTTSVGATTFSTELITAFYTDSATNYLSGLPVSVKTKKTDANGTSLTRTLVYAYEGSGLIKSQWVEPDNSSLMLATSYKREGNVYGLINTQTHAWSNPACGDTGWMAIKKNSCATNISVIVSDLKYDSKGRFAISSKNALGQLESRTYDAKSGAQTSLTDGNQLTTSWTVDSLGRITAQETPDHNQKRSSVRDCQGVCPNSATVAQVIEFFHDNVRIAPSQITYADSAGHPVRSMTWGFDGRTIVVDRRYDSLGRLKEEDFPRFVDDARYLAKRLDYDNFNRLINTTTVDSGGIEKSAHTLYAGLVTTQTNPNFQKRIETRDAIGQLIKVEDANYPVRGITEFAYDPFGSLNKTTDPNKNVISIAYDLLGRRTLLTDPDLGKIAYGVDPAGRTWWHESPNHRSSGKKTYTEFDELGRMVGRYEPDLESHWIFDTAVHGIGQLAETYTVTAAGKKDYSRVHTYDAFGRPDSARQTLSDGVYSSKVGYDQWGRPIMSTYQRGTSPSKIFNTRYNALGYVARVERNGLVLWNAMTQDASGRATSVASGNGLVQSKFFNPYTGRLDKADVSGGGIARLQEGYEYDPIGNVTTRSQYWDAGGFVEGLHYDTLNRVDRSWIGNIEKFYTYDLAGNIQNKTGTGTYTYPTQGANAIRPHAVSTVVPSVGNIDRFGYDGNGNLTSGSTFGTWTTFDMPIRLTKGEVWADFTYSSEHQRTSQTRSDMSKMVYAGAQEVETTGDVTTVKTYWPNGIGVEIDRGTSATELNWTHNDRLGSPVALTTETGLIREKLEYDVWGKRRSTVDNESIQGSLVGKTDNRGFTGHEMLDHLGLVHMNGRIYNPLVGRFMSGDPFVQDILNGQNYNRYSYVLNNPANLTDPTGFLFDGNSICNGGACSIRIENASWSKNASDNDTVEKGEVGSGSIRSSSGSAASRPGNSANRGGSAQGGRDLCAGQDNCEVVTGKRPVTVGTVGSIPNPNGIVPGGPWTVSTDAKPGKFNGPKQPPGCGGRLLCQYVPPEGGGGPKGAKEGYWKVQEPGVKGWQRFDLNGNPITPEQAHPGLSKPPAIEPSNAPTPQSGPQATPAPIPVPGPVAWIVRGAVFLLLMTVSPDAK